MLEQTESLVSAVLDWLLTSASQSERTLVDPEAIWHGRVMAATWLVLVPLSILIARFYKVTPRQDWPNHPKQLTISSDTSKRTGPGYPLR